MNDTLAAVIAELREWPNSLRNDGCLLDMADRLAEIDAELKAEYVSLRAGSDGHFVRAMENGHAAQELRAKLAALVAVLPNTRDLLIAREDALAYLASEQ